MINNSLGHQQSNDVSNMIHHNSTMRIFLHRALYSNREKMNILMQDIRSSFNLFNISYDVNTKVIQLKIKKTYIQKINDDEIMDFYYCTISGILKDFYFRHILSNPWICSDKYIKGYGFTIQDMNTTLSDPFRIRSLFTVTSISDNIIEIIL